MDQEVTAKMAKYCAFQERCTSEVREKLLKAEQSENEADEIIHWLIENNFIDNKRFAITFAEGKFRSKKWGKMKIRFHLEQKEIDDPLITFALEQISDEDYRNTFEELLKEKQRITKGSNAYNKNHKIARFLISRGFEPDMIWEYLRV